jgi:WD repeat-containing protein 35
MDDHKVKQAEIATYFGKFDEAEKLYLDGDRQDLAVALRQRLGDLFQSMQLMKNGAAVDDFQMKQAVAAIGDYYYERKQWQQAASYYAQARKLERLVECLTLVEDYTSLDKLSGSLPEGHPLLPQIAENFALAGMSSESADSYIKFGDVKSAIDVSVQLNNWERAVALAEKYHYREIDEVLTQYAKHLLEQRKEMDAINLFHKAQCPHQSGRLLMELGRHAISGGRSPLLIKKILVLAALELGRSYKSVDTTGDRPWRGAEAYHFYLLAQRQYYQGQFKNALVTASRLRDYEDWIEPNVVHALTALLSYYSQQYATCSRAIAKLEQSVPDSRLETLAFDIFTNYDPVDTQISQRACPQCSTAMDENAAMCSTCQTVFPVCVATGQLIYDGRGKECPTCKHMMTKEAYQDRSSCALCHQAL